LPPSNIVDSGTVHIIYGSATGLSHTGPMIINESTPGILGGAQASDHFGAAVAAGDFNNDTFADLAVGVPGKESAGRFGDRHSGWKYNQRVEPGNCLRCGRGQRAVWAGKRRGIVDVRNTALEPKQRRSSWNGGRKRSLWRGAVLRNQGPRFPALGLRGREREDKRANGVVSARHNRIERGDLSRRRLSMKTRYVFASVLLELLLVSPALAQVSTPNAKLKLKNVEAQVLALQAQVVALQNQLNAQKAQNAFALGDFVTIENGTIKGLAGPHIIISGANVHIQNAPVPTAVNGLGNLIVGANDDSFNTAEVDAARTGSHNLVVGDEHKYIANNGLIAGLGNFVSADNGSVTGGQVNEASADSASVSGGLGNIASGILSSVTGGSDNKASGLEAVVSAGGNNMASGRQAAVVGGASNVASGQLSSVSGGTANLTSALFASVTGGTSNVASAGSATVNGGECNTAGATKSGFGCGGGVGAQGATVSGGNGNLASGNDSSVGGGHIQTESTPFTNLN
jgi:hypothetical protein